MQENKDYIIKCPSSLKGLNNKVKIFCAGPIQGAPLWQHHLPEIDGAVWLSPRRELRLRTNNLNIYIHLSLKFMRELNFHFQRRR